MSRFKGSYDDPTTIAYFCEGCGHSVASPISFFCEWAVVETNYRGSRKIKLIERRYDEIICPDCGADNDHAWPRDTTDFFWYEAKR